VTEENPDGMAGWQGRSQPERSGEHQPWAEGHGSWCGMGLPFGRWDPLEKNIFVMQNTGKSSESVECAMLKDCDACADMGQL